MPSRRRVGIVVPVHNEEDHLPSCIAGLIAAIDHAGPMAIGQVFFVCDACTDASQAIVEQAGFEAIVVEARSVGVARATGAAAAIRWHADWLAFTDADTVVSPSWITRQLELQADVVCGTIAVHAWHHYDERVRLQFEETYVDADGHQHVHGANLGMTTSAYLGVGGFGAMPFHEDVAIVKALEASGAKIAWSSAPRVTTSARPDFRAAHGFGAAVAAAAVVIANASRLPMLQERGSTVAAADLDAATAGGPPAHPQDARLLTPDLSARRSVD